MAKCPHCNSEHAASEYRRGWFVLGTGEDAVIKEVQGEGECLRLARAPRDEWPSNQIFWTLEGAREVLQEQRGERNRGS